LRQQPVLSTRSRCNTLSLGRKLIISSLHTVPYGQPPRSRLDYNIHNLASKVSYRPIEKIYSTGLTGTLGRSFTYISTAIINANCIQYKYAINQFNPKGSKYPIKSRNRSLLAYKSHLKSGNIFGSDEYGKICPVINFVLRPERASGYPPTDVEVLRFTTAVHEHLDNEVLLAAWHHAMAIALLQSTFDCCKCFILPARNIN
jgi:hypothetical protein